MKYHIEKNSVQETLIIPLYSRAVATRIYPDLYKDETSSLLIGKLDYDFSNIDKQSQKLMYRFGYLEVVMRQNDLAIEIIGYLKDHPSAAVVNLGCGLDDTGRGLDNGKCKIYNLDYEDVIKVRNELLPPIDREINIACDINDTSWFDRIDSSDGVIFFASGVFYYFLNEDVRKLVGKMADRFKDGRLVFDAANKKAAKLIRKTWLKKAKIKNVDAYFYVSNAKKELSIWNDNIVVSSKGYMLGYNSLKVKSVSHLFRCLAKLGDNIMKMQIVRVDFKKQL